MMPNTYMANIIKMREGSSINKFADSKNQIVHFSTPNLMTVHEGSPSRNGI